MWSNQSIISKVKVGRRIQNFTNHGSRLGLPVNTSSRAGFDACVICDLGMLPPDSGILCTSILRVVGLCRRSRYWAGPGSPLGQSHFNMAASG